ncbi:MAG TPA: hypothetical protein ENK82_01600, partial [Campylobacterales bacterium]|nr:hypothetical protein [Campylobacterales bacterium]
MRLAIILLPLLLVVSIVNASSQPSFDEIKKMPSSYAKDYYTWRYISEYATSNERAREAYLWTKRKNHKLKKAIKKKLGYVPKKLKLPKKLPDPNNYIIYPATAAKKNLKELKKLHSKIKNRGQYSDVLDVVASDTPFDSLNQKPSSTLCYIFNNIGTKYRKKHFNHPFSPKKLESLIHEKQFNTTIQKIVTTPLLNKTKKSLVFMIEDNNLSFESNFLLAMNAIEFNHKDVAKNFLKLARNKTSYQSKF